MFHGDTSSDAGFHRCRIPRILALGKGEQFTPELSWLFVRLSLLMVSACRAIGGFAWVAESELDAETWNRYRLRWREAVRDPSAPRALLASVRMTFGVAIGRFGQDDKSI